MQNPEYFVQYITLNGLNKIVPIFRGPKNTGADPGGAPGARAPPDHQK